MSAALIVLLALTTLLCSVRETTPDARTITELRTAARSAGWHGVAEGVRAFTVTALLILAGGLGFAAACGAYTAIWLGDLSKHIETVGTPNRLDRAEARA